jgi:hypothetical protein
MSPFPRHVAVLVVGAYLAGFFLMATTWAAPPAPTSTPLRAAPITTGLSSFVGPVRPTVVSGVHGPGTAAQLVVPGISFNSAAQSLSGYNPWLPAWSFGYNPFGFPVTAGWWGSGAPAPLYAPNLYGVGASTNGQGLVTSVPARVGSGYIGPFDLPPDAKPDRTLAVLRRFGGGLDWPVALRQLPPTDEMRELRQRIDQRVEQLLRQPADQSTGADLLQELSRDVQEVQQRFANKPADLPITARQEADARRFLRRLHDALATQGASPNLSTTP